MKKVLTAAAVVATMALVACGGSDKKDKSDSTAASSSNKALSYSDFGTQADALCAKVTATTKPVGDKITGQAASDAPLLKELLPKLEAGIETFKQLKPPAELQDTFDQFNAISDQQVAKTKEAEGFADAGDQESYVASLGDLQTLAAQSDALGSQLGAPACADNS
jgi:hypothetical protein